MSTLRIRVSMVQLVVEGAGQAPVERSGARDAVAVACDTDGCNGRYTTAARRGESSVRAMARARREALAGAWVAVGKAHYCGRCARLHEGIILELPRGDR